MKGASLSRVLVVPSETTMWDRSSGCTDVCVTSAARGQGPWGTAETINKQSISLMSSDIGGRKLDGLLAGKRGAWSSS
jgi:hypothetical protein